MIKEQQEIMKSAEIENIGLVPMNVVDHRNSSTDFDLNGLVDVISRVKGEEPYLLSKEFSKLDYGKFMKFGFSESEYWNEAIKKALAIEIIATNPLNPLKIKSREGLTKIEIKVLMPENNGRVFNFYFNKEGQYYNANFNSVCLDKKTLDENNLNEFTLVENKENEVKE